MTTQNLWDAAKAAPRGKFTTKKLLPQETRKIRTRQPDFTPKTTADKRKAPKLVEGRKSQRPKQE